MAVKFSLATMALGNREFDLAIDPGNLQNIWPYIWTHLAISRIPKLLQPDTTTNTSLCLVLFTTIMLLFVKI